MQRVHNRNGVNLHTFISKLYLLAMESQTD